MLELGEAATPQGNLRSAKDFNAALLLEEYEKLLPFFTHGERMELEGLLREVKVPLWEPFPGPQTVALDCPADELFYGGSAGGGKTDLLLGSALTRHRNSVIFRREYAELKGIRERAWELFSDIGRFNAQQEIWRFKGDYEGKRIEFGACQFEGDERKFQGRPHDLKGFDEVTGFTEQQYRFLIVWNRSVVKGQRVRVIATGNPPTNAQGMWVIKYWAPWLDPKHPRPAEEGELRWFVTGADGKDVEVDGPDPVEVKMEDGSIELIPPKSRTFIRARVEHNPRLMETGYRTVLQNLPEPLRSRMLKGDFGVGQEDDEWQVIPTDWVLKAQARWAPTFEEWYVKRAVERLKAAEGASEAAEAFMRAVREVAGGTSAEAGIAAAATALVATPVEARKSGIDITRLRRGGGGIDLEALTKVRIEGIPTPEEIAEARRRAEEEGAVGVDVSRGGKDDTIASNRLDQWFAELIPISGKKTKDGHEVIQELIRLGFKDRKLQVDVTGVGTSPVDIGKMYEMNVIPMVMKGKSRAKDRSGKLGFTSLRAEWWWKFREALDPVLGDDLALPPDPELTADLTAPRWGVTSRGIQVEEKAHIKSRLGRSPDRGDAVVIAHAVPTIVAEAYLYYMKELAEQSST